MSVSTSDFLAQASRLLSEKGEIDHRSSISRAYYAIYHEAKIAAGRMTLPHPAKQSTGSHEKLFSRYESGGKRLKVIARLLRAKKLTRNTADYELGEDVTKAEAVQFLADAEKLSMELSRLGVPAAKVAE